jgi:hypothetical protein
MFREYIDGKATHTYHATVSRAFAALEERYQRRLYYKRAPRGTSALDEIEFFVTETDLPLLILRYEPPIDKEQAFGGRK